MKTVQADFNNVGADGRLSVARRRLGPVELGETLVLTDPGNEEGFVGIVAEVRDRTVLFDVDWDQHSIVHYWKGHVQVVTASGAITSGTRSPIPRPTGAFAGAA